MVVSGGARQAGLGAALVVSQGLPTWVRGWRACAPRSSAPRAPARAAVASDLVEVLAAMALACA